MLALPVPAAPGVFHGAPSVSRVGASVRTPRYRKRSCCRLHFMVHTSRPAGTCTIPRLTHSDRHGPTAAQRKRGCEHVRVRMTLPMRAAPQDSAQSRIYFACCILVFRPAADSPAQGSLSRRRRCNEDHGAPSRRTPGHPAGPRGPRRGPLARATPPFIAYACLTSIYCAKYMCAVLAKHQGDVAT
jgi:hypothetical protein